MGTEPGNKGAPSEEKEDVVTVAGRPGGLSAEGEGSQGRDEGDRQAVELGAGGAGFHQSNSVPFINRTGHASGIQGEARGGDGARERAGEPGAKRTRGRGGLEKYGTGEMESWNKLIYVCQGGAGRGTGIFLTGGGNMRAMEEFQGRVSDLVEDGPNGRWGSG